MDVQPIPTRDFAADFDHRDPDFNRNFYRVLADLRRTCPVARNQNDGWWFVSRYQEVREVLVDWQGYRSGDGVSGIAGAPRLLPLESDRPEHADWRHALNPYFTPDAVAPYRSTVTAIADGLLDDVIEDGACEFVDRFALPLPGLVFFTCVLGLPEQDVRRCQLWVDKATRSWEDPDASVWGFRQLGAFVAEMIDDRRRNGTADGVLRAVLDARIGGRPATPEEQISTVLMLILGGLDTTANVLGSGTHYLATHPADRKRLRELSVPRRSAVEELLRLFAPTVFLGRTAAGPHCLGGREIAAGDFVTVSYASANRDDQEFAEPTEFRPEREPNRHLAFGLGPHRCLGAHLARLVIDVALDRILERLQDLRLAAGQKAFFHTSVTHGAVRLPIEFTPGRRLQPAY